MSNNTPGQPQLPQHLIAFNHAKDYESIRGFLQWAKDNVWQYMMNEQKLRTEHQSFLLYGFLAETGLTPSKCMLVEKRTTKGEMFWGYVAKDPAKEKFASELDNQIAEIKRLNGIVKYSESLIRELREEVTHLKAKL